MRLGVRVRPLVSHDPDRPSCREAELVHVAADGGAVEVRRDVDGASSVVRRAHGQVLLRHPAELELPLDPLGDDWGRVRVRVDLSAAHRPDVAHVVEHVVENDAAVLDLAGLCGPVVRSDAERLRRAPASMRSQILRPRARTTGECTQRALWIVLPKKHARHPPHLLSVARREDVRDVLAALLS